MRRYPKFILVDDLYIVHGGHHEDSLGWDFHCTSRSLHVNLSGDRQTLLYDTCLSALSHPISHYLYNISDFSDCASCKPQAILKWTVSLDTHALRSAHCHLLCGLCYGSVNIFLHLLNVLACLMALVKTDFQANPDIKAYITNQERVCA